MMKKSLFVKSLSSALSATILVGFISYSQSQNERQKIDLSAFKNLSANIQHLSKGTIDSAETMPAKVTERIIAHIDDEIKTNIKKQRIAFNKAKKLTPPVKELIAKDWNDIAPKFDAVKYEKIKITEPQELNDSLINNSELIKLYAIKAERIGFLTFANTSIPEIIEITDTLALDKMPTVETSKEVIEKVVQEEVQDDVKDEVSSTMASTAPDNSTDDMVMFDYSTSEVKTESEQAMPKMFDSPLSKSVKEAIQRELQQSPVAAINSRSVEKEEKKNVERNEDTKKIKPDSLDKIMENEDNIVYDYSQDKASSTKGASFTDSLDSDMNSQPQEKEFIIKAKEINLTTQKSRSAVGYEFVPDYDRAERMDDQANGEIKFGYSLADESNTLTGIVQAQGVITTRVELNLADGGMTIPLINEEGIQKLLIKKGMNIQGNLAMFAIDPSIKDVELDSSYEAKMLFDRNFKNVDSVEKANYVMFLGVQSGNVLLRYLLDNKESAQKIIYIGDGELFFEDAGFVNTQREMFTFTTRSLLGKKVKELNIDSSLIGIFGTKTTSKKKALNAYELKVPEMISGARTYLEFRHLPATLYVGTTEEKNIEVPGMDFIKKVLQANDMDEPGQRCVVQLNLSRDLREIKVSGKNKAGEMFTELSYLDTDGNFSTDNAELSEKIFILGDMEGQFGARIEYSDGSVQFLKTFCSEGSYLIEQL